MKNTCGRPPVAVRDHAVEHELAILAAARCRPCTKNQRRGIGMQNGNGHGGSLEYIVIVPRGAIVRVRRESFMKNVVALCLSDVPL